MTMVIRHILIVHSQECYYVGWWLGGSTGGGGGA